MVQKCMKVIFAAILVGCHIATKFIDAIPC